VWRVSRAEGLPFRGHLVDGVQLPAAGPDWFTWDPVFDRVPNRGWRRWGTDGLLRTILAVLREYRAADPDASRVGIMDLSRHRGGWFGPTYGGLGHASHQNGLDADVLYPRRDGRERRAFRPGQVDLARAQDLVDRFVAAGAEKIFVGPSLDLQGPPDVVIPLVNHDDHLHVRMPPPPE
jgi:murein endopeptidase